MGTLSKLWTSCPFLRTAKPVTVRDNILLEMLSGQKPRPYPNEVKCDGCIFKKSLSIALATLRHDRFGTFAYFGIGKRVMSGKLRTNDKQVLLSFLEKDLSSLVHWGIRCPWLGRLSHPFAKVVEALEDIIFKIKSQKIEADVLASKMKTIDRLTREEL